MSSNPPETLIDARRLLEVPAATSVYTVNEDAPIRWFLDSDNRLMEVVWAGHKVGEHRKVCRE